jgi:hypothetical protein
MIDIDKQTQPDSVADIADPDSMNRFPNASVDEIYLEGIFPAFPQLAINTYCNAARILKKGGMFIMDNNGGFHKTRLKVVQEKFQAIFRDYGIPLAIYRGDERIERNDYYPRNEKLAFFKNADSEINLTEPENKSRLRKAQLLIVRCHREYGSHRSVPYEGLLPGFSYAELNQEEAGSTDVGV